MHCTGPAAAGMQRGGLQRSVAILLRNIGVERFRRSMHQVTGNALDRTVSNNALMHGVVGPACAPAIEQAYRPIGIAFTVRKPATEKTIPPRDRIGACAR